ncbi:MAG TPA: hypothetical protein VGP93_13115 [Polyangiaceae bacterium]|jgi:hypothetical protein|nr:hypothetical protein [Polyangiaceae bacterium]
MNRLLSILSGAGAGGGGCVANGATMTGLYSCAENNNCTASGDSSHAEGDGSTATALAAHAQNWNTLASGVGSSAEGFDTYAESDISHAGGSQAWTLVQTDFAHASGQFAERGDAQYRFHELRGETPGVAVGETVRLRIGNNECDLRPGRVAAVTATVVANVVGSDPPEYAQFVRRFVLACSVGGNATISTVREENDITEGSTLAGSSVLAEATGFDNTWSLTFGLAELTQANVRAVAHVEFVELGGVFP